MLPPESIPDIFARLVLVYLPIILISVWLMCLFITYKSGAIVSRLTKRTTKRPNYPQYEIELGRDLQEIKQESES